MLGERGVAVFTEAELGSWLENSGGWSWATRSSERAWTSDEIAALECLACPPEDVADTKAQLPPDAARQAGGVEAPGAGGSGGEPLAFREAVRRVFQRFGHAECVQGGRVVWIRGRE